MAEDLQAMLSSMGEKFDMSFDEGQQEQEEGKLAHHRSINPENRIEPPSSPETHQPIHQEENTKEGNNSRVKSGSARDLQSIQADIEGMAGQVPFLPLLEKEQAENDAEIPQDKLGPGQGETGVQFSCEEQEVEYYRSLSEKFEDALNKAHSRKSISTCYHGQFMQRQQHFQRKRQNGLTQLLQEKESRERSYFRGKPLINSYSHQILPHHTPIEQRYPAVLAERKRKIDARQAERQRLAEEEREQELREIEKWQEEVRERVGEVRSSEEYFETQQRWSERRYKIIEENGKKQEEILRAQASFKPKINSRSDNLMKKKPQRVPVYEKEPELKKLPVDPHCTFKPNLSKTLKRI